MKTRLLSLACWLALDGVPRVTVGHGITLALGGVGPARILHSYKSFKNFNVGASGQSDGYGLARAK